MGVVYRARQRSLNRIVAVKLLLFGRFASDEFVRRFRAEAEIAASLRHPNIVGIHEVAEEDGQHYFSMELVEGRGLDELVRDRPLTAADAARHVRTIAGAVEHAHRRGLLHRDLKPSNVLVDADGQPRIADFGLAKRLFEERELTVAGQVLGSPAYMAPEQADPSRGDLGPAGDVYSLGAILYHLLTGRPPFVAETVEGTLEQLLEREPLPPRSLNAGVPRDLEVICLRCLEKQSARRYPTAEALAADLSRFLAGEPILARPVSRWEKAGRWCRRKPALALLGAALVVSIISGIGGVAWQVRRANAAAHTSRAAAADAREQLRTSELARARLARVTPASGRREASLRAVRAAAAIRPGLDARDEAISALAVPDVAFVPVAPMDGRDGLVFSPHLDWLVGLGPAAQAGPAWPVHGSNETVRLGSAVDAQFSADGRWLGTIDQDRKLAIRDWPDRRSAIDWPSRVERFAFVPGPDALVVLDADRKLSLTNLETGRMEWEQAWVEYVWSIAPSPDGRWLGLIASGGTAIHILARADGHRLVSLPMPGSGVRCASWSADAKWIAAGLMNGSIALWSSGRWTLHGLWPAHDQPVVSVGFDPPGRWLASTSLGNDCRWWSWPDLRLAMEARTCVRTGQAQFSPDGGHLAWGISNGAVGVFAVQPSEILRRLPGQYQQGLTWGAVTFSPDGASLAIASSSGLSIIDWARDRILAEDTSTPCLSAQFVRDGDRLFVTRSDGLCERSWLGPTRGGRGGRLGPRRAIAGLAAGFADGQLRGGILSADERRFAVANIGAGHIEVFAVSNLAQRVVLAPHANAGTVAISSNGTYVASGGPGRVLIWEVATGRPIHSLAASGKAAPVLAFSPDDRLLVLGDDEYHLLNVGSWVERYRIPGRASPKSGAAFSADGRYLAVAVDRSRVRLVEASTGRPLCTLEAPEADLVLGLAFSPDGRVLAAVDAGRGLVVWDLRRIEERLATMRLAW